MASSEASSFKRSKSGSSSSSSRRSESTPAAGSAGLGGSAPPVDGSDPGAGPSELCALSVLQAKAVLYLQFADVAQTSEEAALGEVPNLQGGSSVLMDQQAQVVEGLDGARSGAERLRLESDALKCRLAEFQGTETLEISVNVRVVRLGESGASSFPPGRG